VRIDLVDPLGQVNPHGPFDRTGNASFQATQIGSYTLRLFATILLNGETRDAISSVVVSVT